MFCLPLWASQFEPKKNANILLSLQSSDWNITPTSFQRSTFPASFRSVISTIHDGIDTDLASPGAVDFTFYLKGVGKLIKGQPIITFVNRNLEPYRGYHSFMRSLPELLSRRSNAYVLVLGGDLLAILVYYELDAKVFWDVLLF